MLPQAHGALYKGKPIATLADITCYSFYPARPRQCDAGALVTDNPEWALKAPGCWQTTGRTKKYRPTTSNNSRLDGLQAAVLNVKLRPH